MSITCSFPALDGISKEVSLWGNYQILSHENVKFKIKFSLRVKNLFTSSTYLVNEIASQVKVGFTNPICVKYLNKTNPSLCWGGEKFYRETFCLHGNNCRRMSYDYMVALNLRISLYIFFSQCRSWDDILETFVFFFEISIYSRAYKCIHLKNKGKNHWDPHSENKT